MPAASGSATLTTCTVTMTTCVAPVMPTGFLAGKSATPSPPARSFPRPSRRCRVRSGATTSARWTREDGAAGERAERDNAGHPSAQVSIPGVMSRRRGAPVTDGPGVSEKTPPVHRGGGGKHPRGPRRVAAPRDRPTGGQPIPVAAARQRWRERLAARDELVARAETVASIADLEELAALVANFFGKDAPGVSRGGAPGVRDCPDRSRGEGVPDRRGPVPVGPQESGEGREGCVREATRRQALYRANRRRAVQEVLQGPAESCQLLKQRIQAYFEGLYSGGELLDTPDVEAEHTQPPAEGEGFEYLLDPFTEIEVDRRLRRMTNSTPGPDGITYRVLRGADPGVRLLTMFFNACLRHETVPMS
ncbi:hypothetical protein ACFW04_012617 [Cataglyphis niger]